jgi:NADH dehydrogenase
MSMTVAVTGASGFVGRHIVRELLARDFKVRALVREVAAARKALGADPGLTLVAGDVLDSDAPPALIAGCGACIHLIGIIREEAGKSFQKMHVEATRAVLHACRSAGLRRYLHMSALGVSDEGVSDYQRTKWEAEQLVRRTGLDWTIFRPALIHGPESEFIQMAKGWVSGSKPPFKFLPYFTRPQTDHSVPLGPTRYTDPLVQPVAVEDVAIAFAAALDGPQSIGEVYNLVGPAAMTWPEMLLTLRDELPGARDDLRPRGVPADLAAAGATAAAAVGLGSLLPFDRGMALMGAQDCTASPAKAHEHLGFSPRPFRPTLMAYADRV